MKYSLAIPFMQQIFQLAVQGGFTGQITANSFMKREFGKKLIESFIPTVNLTHVIDTSGPTYLDMARQLRSCLAVINHPLVALCEQFSGFVANSPFQQIRRKDAFGCPSLNC